MTVRSPLGARGALTRTETLAIQGKTPVNQARWTGLSPDKIAPRETRNSLSAGFFWWS